MQQIIPRANRYPGDVEPRLAEQLHLVRGELDLLNKILLQESLFGFPDGNRRMRLSTQREELRREERKIKEALAQQ